MSETVESGMAQDAANWEPLSRPKRPPILCRWLGHWWMTWKPTEQRRCRRCLIFAMHPKARSEDVTGSLRDPPCYPESESDGA